MRFQHPTHELRRERCVLGPQNAPAARRAQTPHRIAKLALSLILAATLLPAVPALGADLPPPPFEPETKPARKKRDDKQAPTNKSDKQATPSPAESWVIVLAAFRGEGAQAQATAALNEARFSAGLSDAFVEARGENVIVAYGRFTGPDAPEAADALQRIRSLTVAGVQPYAGAFLAPPFTVKLGSRPEHNLLTAKELYGKDALYTLQIGAYGRDDLPNPTEDDLKEARRAAEEAAAKLRQEGELAFYYHGPNRSMVTIGVFNSDDFDPQTPGYQSRRLQEARKRFPHNLYNGAGIKVTRPGRKPHLQPSRLVNIPDR